MVKRIVLFLMAIAILVALAILFSPMIIGNQIKNHYPEILAQLFPSEKIQVKVLSYERSWYTDRASIQVDLSRSGWTVNGKNQLILQQTIDVGPILRQPDGGYRWQLARITTRYHQGKINYLGNVLLDLHRTVVADAALPTLQLSKDNKTSTLTQINVQLQVKPGAQKIQANFGNIISWSSPTEQAPTLIANGVQLHNTSVDYHTNGANDMAIHITQLRYGNQPAKEIHARQVLIQRKTLKHGDTLTVNYRFYAKQFRIGYNPNRTLEADFTVNRLSEDLLNHVARDITAFLQPAQAINPLDIMQDLLKLQSNGLQIAINKLYMSSANGPIELNGSIRLSKATSLAEILNPLAALQVTLHGKAPSQWFLAQTMNHKRLNKRQATTQIADWLKNGLLRQEGNELLFSLTYKNGGFYLGAPDHQQLARFYWTKPRPVVKQ